jgi:hypothetical protein
LSDFSKRHNMGKDGVVTMNELCGNHSLKIGGTLFPYKE